jgi:thiol-disulfide isomerase/thioredoxin
MTALREISRSVLTTFALCVTFSLSAAAQNASQTASQDNSRKSPEVASSQQLAQNNLSAQPDQQMSLGELARAARARKSSEAKAAKVIDDENIPKGGIYIGGSAPDSSTSPSKFGGKLTLLDFWASWCGPCRESLPDLKRLQAVYGSDQLEVISISEDENERTWNNFVSQNQMTWEQRFDSTREEARRYGVTGFPTYILLDSNGKVIQEYRGEVPQQSLADRIGPDVRKAQQAAATPPAVSPAS